MLDGAVGVSTSLGATASLRSSRVGPRWRQSQTARAPQRPGARERIREDRLTPSDDWENEWQQISGPESVLIASVLNPKLLPLHQRPTVFQQSDGFHENSPFFTESNLMSRLKALGSALDLLKAEPASRVGLYALCRSELQSCIFAQDSKLWKLTSGNSRRSAARSTAKPTRSNHSYILTASSPIRWRMTSSGTW